MLVPQGVFSCVAEEARAGQSKPLIRAPSSIQRTAPRRAQRAHTAAATMLDSLSNNSPACAGHRREALADLYAAGVAGDYAMPGDCPETPAVIAYPA